MFGLDQLYMHRVRIHKTLGFIVEAQEIKPQNTGIEESADGWVTIFGWFKNKQEAVAWANQWKKNNREEAI